MPVAMKHRSPLRSVWLHPSQTIARIAHENPGYRLIALPIIAGFATWPTIAFFSTDIEQVEIGLFWLALLSYGPVFEVLQLFVGAYLIRATGIWLGGKAGLASIQTAIAWGNAPIAALTILSIPLMIAAAILAETSEADFLSEPTMTVLPAAMALTVIQFLFVIWSLAIFVRGLASVQGFSTARALLNTFVACVIPVAMIVSILVVAGRSDSLASIFFAGSNEIVYVGTE